MEDFKKLLKYVDEGQLHMVCAELQRSVIIVMKDKMEEMQTEIRQISSRVQGLSNIISNLQKRNNPPALRYDTQKNYGKRSRREDSTNVFTSVTDITECDICTKGLSCYRHKQSE